MQWIGYPLSEFGKQAVLSARVPQWSKEESSPASKVARMLPRWRPPETSQNKVVIRVVLHIPKRHILL